MLLSLLEIGGPSYKVTVPCVTQIASMRLRQSNALLTKSSVNLLAHNAHEDEAVSEDKSAETNDTTADSISTDKDQDSSKDERN